MLHSSEGYIYSPSICFGLKKYNRSELREKYIDLQMMLLPDGRVVDGGFPIGFGIGTEANKENKDSKKLIVELFCLFSIFHNSVFLLK